MQHFASFVLCALLLPSVRGSKNNTSSEQCTVSRVCVDLENILKGQGRLEKNVNTVLGGHCSEGGKAFSATAHSHYTLDALGADKYLMCRALAHPVNESQAYSVSAELLNQAGLLGINGGHLGLLFNAVDENNFNFVYFRPHSVSGCYQTGYMANGKPTFVKSAACPNGPPKGGVWFPVSVTVHGQDVQVYHSGVLVTSIKSHFAPKAWGGVFTFHGWKNVILFRKFKTVPVVYVIGGEVNYIT